jgi:hypothetical protein
MWNTHPPRETWEALPDPKKKLIRYWVAGLVALYSIVTVIALSVVYNEKRDSDNLHAIRMSSDRVEPGLTPPEALPPTGDFVTVNVGLYVDSVDTFSIKDSFWTATFYVWFRWSGDKDLDPTKNVQLVDARIEKKEVLEQHAGADGVNYQRARISARLFKTFNTTRVPLDDHLLVIALEDGARDGTKLRYVADSDSNVSSRVRIAGYKVSGFSAVVKNHTYKSAYGDPRFKDGARKTFTEFVYGLKIARMSMGLYFKLLLALFAGITLTICSFFIRPPDNGSRFSLPTASYFGAVANSYTISSTLPSTGQFGLIDYVTALGLMTIFLCMSATLVSAYYHTRKDEAFSRTLDRATRTTVGIMYILANVALPLTAFSHI